jgi:hypothetical protein
MGDNEAAAKIAIRDLEARKVLSRDDGPDFNGS